MSDDVYDQLPAAPRGPVRVRLLEEAIREADTQQDDERAAGLRNTLVTEAIGAGMPDRALVAFTWLRNHERRDDPDSALSSALLWKLKWMAEELPFFLGVSVQQLDDFYDDMRREYERAGSSLRPYFQNRMMGAMELGRPRAEVTEHYVQWQSGLRDGGADCAACERHVMVEYQLYQGDLRQALEMALPLVRETLRCWQVPHRTVGVLLLPMYDAGRGEQVVELHEQFYERSRNRGDLLGAMGAHIEICALTCRLERARQALEQHLRMALDNAAELRRLPLLMGAHAVLTRLARAGKPVRLDVPLVQLTSTESSTVVMTEALREALRTGLPSLEAEGRAKFDADVLVEGFEAELRHVVERADARGDRQHYAQRLERYRARHA